MEKLAIMAPPGTTNGILNRENRVLYGTVVAKNRSGNQNLS
jgi:hypothetical protein